jgi:6-phosphogluconolactonase
MSVGRRFLSLCSLGALLSLSTACGNTVCGGNGFTTTGSSTGGGSTGGTSSTCGSSTGTGSTGTGGNTTTLDYLYVVDNTNIAADSFDGTQLQSLTNFSQPSLGPGAVADMIVVNKSFLYQPWAPAAGGSEIQAFALAANGGLSAVSGSPFTTPAVGDALGTDPNGKFLFVGQSATQQLSVYQINSSSGALTSAPGSPYTLPVAAAQVVVDGTGTYLYAVANQGSGIVFGFSIDPTTGALTELAGSPYIVFVSRLAAHPSGSYLFGVGGGNLYTLPIDASGNLSISATITPVSPPNEVLVHPTGNFLYTFAEAVSSIEGFSLDASGNPTPLTGSPFTAITQMNDAKMDENGTAMVGLTASQQFYMVVINPTTGALTAPTTPFTGFSSNYFALTN